MSGLEFRRLHPGVEAALAAFFRTLVDGGDDVHFHPHAFSDEVARRLCRREGDDLYYVAVDEETILAYGMLRGWEEGFAVPSLGIAVLADVRGTGLARVFLEFLHQAARVRGASRVRLKVHPDNLAAVRLYQRVGYVFDEAPAADGQRVAHLSLETSQPSP